MMKLYFSAQLFGEVKLGHPEILRLCVRCVINDISSGCWPSAKECFVTSFFTIYIGWTRLAEPMSVSPLNE